MSEELNKLEQLFHAALELASAEERARYLAQACGADVVLRQRVDKLLRAHETAGHFLNPETPPIQADLPIGGVELPPSEKPGDQIGRYTLVERLGEGGCCVVYRAEQLEPVRRQVALKLVKMGMDTRQVVARFEIERQALALMDHPHIAKVFDAGVTATGRPYFVMELLRGVPITPYCDQRRLTVQQRLELFMQVCHAVQHAHQKGVIHRDLKPSNILVTTTDGEGPATAESALGKGESGRDAGQGYRPSDSPPVAPPGQPTAKVIDFGIAKAVQARLTDREVVTWFGQVIGTPAYMSPEQARLNSDDIDARADIYALGVLLYELLTGATPFGKETLAAAPVDEIQRMILEMEPPKPSTRLHGMGEKLVEVARQRQTEPGVLRRLVRGDLDWIVMKALEKDRQRRYATAHDLAADIQRHLAHEPVLAGPPSALYRARKFVRRHRVGVGAGAAAVLALVTGLSLALAGLQRARDAESSARREQARAVQAEADARGMLELFRDKTVADNEMIGLLHAAALIARDQLGVTNPATLNLVSALAPNLGRVGAWTNALELYFCLIEADPGNADYWECAHAAALAAPQLEVCRRLRQGMIDRFAASGELTHRLQLAKALLVAPEEPAHLGLAAECASQAVRARPKDPLCQTVQGMAEYRRGHSAEALKWLEEAERSAGPNGAALACAFGAMARQRLGRTTEAGEALARTSQQLRLPLEMGQLLAKDWHEVVLGVVARAEAERLIVGREVSPPVTADSLARAREKWKSVGEPLVRAEVFARQGRWQESRDAYLQALDHPAFDWSAAEAESPARCLSLHMGTVFARCGDRTNHTRLCRLLLALHPEKPASPAADRDATVLADRYAKTCFLYNRALSPELRQAALDLTRFAVANQRKRKDHHNAWVCQAGGTAEYYAGQPERALELLLEAEADNERSSLPRGIAIAYRAMVLKKLDRPVEAARALQAAESLLSQPAGVPLSLYWWDFELYKLAVEEARQVLRDEAK